jgi:hypothetical protein
MIAAVVVVGHESLDLVLQIARQIVVLEQDAVFQRLVPTLDLTLCHRVIGRAADVGQVMTLHPFRQIVRDV